MKNWSILLSFICFTLAPAAFSHKMHNHNKAAVAQSAEGSAQAQEGTETDKNMDKEKEEGAQAATTGENGDQNQKEESKATPLWDIIYTFVFLGGFVVIMWFLLPTPNFDRDPWKERLEKESQ